MHSLPFSATLGLICGTQIYHSRVKCKVKDKAILLQAYTGPEGSRRLRHMKVVNPTHWPPLALKEYSWY
jgi:hypothetical protein